MRVTQLSQRTHRFNATLLCFRLFELALAVVALLCFGFTIEREFSRAPVVQDIRMIAALPFIATTTWTALIDCAGVNPPPLSSLPKLPCSGPTALIHGAGGPLGCFAARLLTLWGWHVIATIKKDQSATALQKCAAQVIVTNESNGNNVGWVPDWVTQLSRNSISLFLDGVGGAEPQSAAMVLLKENGCCCSLRGAIVPLVDEHGLLQGGALAAAEYVINKARFASIGASYHWVLNTPQRRGLEYCRDAIEQGHDLFVTVNPAGQYRGIEGIKEAIQTTLHQTVQHKIVINIDAHRER